MVVTARIQYVKQFILSPESLKMMNYATFLHELLTKKSTMNSSQSLNENFELN